MVRQVAERLASLFRDEKIQVICVLGGPFIGKTWLVNHILESEKNYSVEVFDNVNTYDEFEYIIKHKCNSLKRYVIVGRLLQEKCTELVGEDLQMEYVNIYPMNFREFSLAVPKAYNISNGELLKRYMLVGGLPEVVKNFVQTADIESVRKKQRQLFENIKAVLKVKGQKVIDSVIEQEVSGGSGFCIRKIDKNARERDYGSVIEELISMGLIEKVERLLSFDDRDVRGYRLSFYDMGIYSMIMELKDINLCNRYGEWDKRLLENFYYKEMRTYIDKQIDAIKYWKKYRGKAQIPIVIEKLGDKEDKRYVTISLLDKKVGISKSAQAFMREYPMTIPVSVLMPTIDNVLEGYGLYNKTSHIT